VKIDLANPAWRQTLPPARTVAADAPVAACAFSRDGATAAFALGDGCVRILPADIKRPRRRRTSRARGAVLALVATGGRRLRSGGDDGRLLHRSRRDERDRQPEGQGFEASPPIYDGRCRRVGRQTPSW
jgi:hypothetical protein